VIAYFHCFSGIAGDMALGALVDAGADPSEVRSLCERLPVKGWSLDFEPVMRNGIGGTKAHVGVDDTTVARTYAHIVGLIEEGRLPDRVRDRALAIFGRLADAEGLLHRRPREQVHFHEVGAVDSIIDIVGVCAALEVLGVDSVQSSAVATGRGVIRAAHGVLPNPSPAVVELMRDAPMYGLDLNIELTTPTGAAILSTLVTRFGPLPEMWISSSGFGAGTKEFAARPNLLQVILGEAEPTGVSRGSASPGAVGVPPGQPAVVLEVNVDDATGETLAHAIGALLEAGAHDAWITPIVMKKGRPAHTVSALVDLALAEQVGRVLFETTGSLGLRSRVIDRWPLAREMHEVNVEGEPVRVKVSPGRVKVEHDDAARAARRSGRPLREVVSLAEQAWRLGSVDDDGGHDHPHDRPHDPNDPTGHAG
jgi:uncharacterized protein (TIGR00299 family) protein